MINVKEEAPFELQRFPYPYRAAFTVASDIDSANIARFRAIHSLFCRSDLIPQDSPEWHTLGLTPGCPRFDPDGKGIRGLGLELADSFFLIGDATTIGMHRYFPQKGCFLEDEQDGENGLVRFRHWIKEGEIDSFHAFLHYKRSQVEPLLRDFYEWCERCNVAKPKVWINHSAAVTPSGLCPDELQPNRLYSLSRLAARSLVGPLFGRKPFPLRYAFVRYNGDTPGSPYYVNDLLAENGLRYVWLNIHDLHKNRMVLPEHGQNGRQTILHQVRMDDGVRYWRFGRCYGLPSGARAIGIYLRDSKEGIDSSHLITEPNLQELCRVSGTCILATHWTHHRSLPLSSETIGRFELLRQWSEAGKIWVTSTVRLLEWTRLRTFLEISCHREGDRLIIEIGDVDDPIFGRQSLELKDLHGVCIGLKDTKALVTIAVKGQVLSPAHLCCGGGLWWIDTKGASDRLPMGQRPEARR